MPTIFSQAPGRAALLSTGAGLPSMVYLEHFTEYCQYTAVLTSLGLQGREGYQMAHTLRDLIYIYSFGRRATAATVQGVAFAGACGGSAGSGLERSYSFFTTYGLSGSGLPVRIVMGTYMSLYGFLVGFDYQTVDPSSGMGSFGLSLQCVPVPAYTLQP